MAPMARIAFLFAVLACALVAANAALPATAGTPCRDRIYADWYADGKIASTYPLACYRDALKHAQGRADIGVYSSMLDDIRLALQAAVKRSEGQQVPAQVGGSNSSAVSATTTPSGTTHTSTTSKKPPTETAPTSPGQDTTTPTTTASPVAASPSSSGGGGGIPVPLLVLGGVAIALVASGAIGLGARRFRR